MACTGHGNPALPGHGLLNMLGRGLVFYTSTHHHHLQLPPLLRGLRHQSCMPAPCIHGLEKLSMVYHSMCHQLHSISVTVWKPSINSQKCVDYYHRYLSEAVAWFLEPCIRRLYKAFLDAGKHCRMGMSSTWNGPEHCLVMFSKTWDPLYTVLYYNACWAYVDYIFFMNELSL